MTLKRGFSRLEGVADAKLILKPAHMEVTMKPGAWPDLPKMEDTIKRAGYKPVPEEIELRVTGKLVKQGDGFALEVAGVSPPMTLALTPGKEGASAEALAGKAGTIVEVAGKWTPAPSAAGSLAITAVK